MVAATRPNPRGTADRRRAANQNACRAQRQAADPTSAYGTIRRLAEAAGVGKLTPHGLRATMVTLALEQGMPLRDVQDSARHADPRTTRRYDRDRWSLNRSAAYRLADLAD